jgi:hypothetical protein
MKKNQDSNEYDSAVWAVNQRQRHRLVQMARQVVRRWMFVQQGKAFRCARLAHPVQFLSRGLPHV